MRSAPRRAPCSKLGLLEHAGLVTLNGVEAHSPRGGMGLAELSFEGVPGQNFLARAAAATAGYPVQIVLDGRAGGSGHKFGMQCPKLRTNCPVSVVQLGMGDTTTLRRIPQYRYVPWLL